LHCSERDAQSLKGRKFLILLFILVFILTPILTCWCQDSYPWIKANYTLGYIKKNKSKVIIEIPEVYELTNIIIAITDYGLSTNRVYKQGEYYERVLRHFLPFKNHPLIPKIEPVVRKSSLFRPLKENSACYVFKKDLIVTGGIYPFIKFLNPFRNHIKLIEEFAVKSQFRNFYRDNLSYYTHQIEKYREKVPIKKMWLWLEKNFPERYDCYKIVFSPLTYGTHMTQRFRDGNFNEILMFISGPEVYEKHYSGKVEEGLLSRMVFTEIDHNYVNPITDKNIERVKNVFSDFKRWNKQSGYDSPYATFNEYMTWAVYILYAYENYEREKFASIKQIVFDQMINSRKFVMFEQFSEKLLEFYSDRKGGETIPDLYLKILDWASKM